MPRQPAVPPCSTLSLDREEGSAPSLATASVTVGGSAPAGVRNVSVTTPGGIATKTGGFTVVSQSPSAPTLTLFSPSEGTQGQTLTVTISGTNLTGATAVSFGPGITTNSLTVNSSTKITASISIDSSASIAARDVSVTTPSGEVTKTDGFAVRQQGASPDETPNDTGTGGGGIPFWVWIVIGVPAVSVVGVGAYLVGRRRVADL